MYQRILVLLDGSTQAEQAIPLAACMARATGGTIILVNTALSLKVTQALSHEAWLARAEDYLAYDLSARYAHDLTGIVIERMVVIGADASAIFAVAQLEEADVLMMCNYGGSAQIQQVVGTSIQKLIRCSPLPVLIVPERNIGLSRSLDDSPYQIVVPLDGTPEAEEALESAALLADALTTSAPGVLQLLYITQRIAPIGPEREYKKIDAFIENETRREAIAYLKSLEHRLLSLVSDRFCITLSIMSCSSPVQAIVERSAQVGEMRSILVMTPHERCRGIHVPMRSALERILKHTTLPVLVVRPHLQELRIQPERSNEVSMCIDEREEEEDFVWSLPWFSLDSSPCSQSIL